MTQQKCHWQGSVQNRKLQPTSTLSQGTHWCLNRETSLTCTMLLIANRQQVISQLPTDLNPYKKKSQKHCKTNSRKISSDPGGNISVLYNLWLRKVCTHILLHSTLKNWTAKFILWKLSFKAYGVWVLFFLFFLRIQFIYLFQYIEYAQFEKSWVVLKCWRIKIKIRRIKDYILYLVT